MEIPMANFIASGGVSAAVVIIFYMTYKACEKKKFKSSCCGASVEVKADLPSPELDRETPAPKLVIRTQEESKDIP
jgi:hypothetical protein